MSNKPQTGMDKQRVDFVESLHNSLKKQAVKAILEHNKFVTLATSYMGDGLEESECVELLMIDGLDREAAESYTALVISKKGQSEEILSNYSFQFEDGQGCVYSSYDIGKVIQAASDEDAWEKAEESLNETGVQKIISVNRVS
jgi:hypothetical protein